jgi:hypothetical protein
MNEILIRLKLPLNRFWAKTRLLLLSISALSITVNEMLEPMLHNEFIPASIHVWLRYVYVAALFGSMLASLTVHDTAELNTKKSAKK